MVIITLKVFIQQWTRDVTKVKTSAKIPIAPVKDLVGICSKGETALRRDLIAIGVFLHSDQIGAAQR
jgi:hypothetical protein